MLMGRVGGYTLIEVMIFLAISGVLFVSAVVLIQGQQGRTQFSQSIRDIDSKLAQYVNEVSASFFPSSDKYSCSLVKDSNNVDRPELTLLATGTKNVGSNEDCIFLGKALQFHQDSPSGNVDDTLVVYSVLGRRTLTVGVTARGTIQKGLVSSFAQANPTPALALTDTYTLPFGTKITSACKIDVSPCSPTTNKSAMASFYVDLSQTGTDPAANKSASLVSYQYPYNVDLTTPRNTNNLGTVYSCLTLNNTACSGLISGPDGPQPSPFDKWVLCFVSAASRQTAKITVSSGTTGIQTKTDYVSC